MKIKPFVISDHLKTNEDMSQYFSEVWQSGNAEAIVGALGDIAKAKGIEHLASITGLNGDSLYSALRPGSNPRFDTIFKIMQGLDIKLQAVVN